MPCCDIEIDNPDHIVLYIYSCVFIRTYLHIFTDAPLHNAAKPLEWLIGKWKGQGKGIYPTIQDFDFLEELEFFHVGQPMLQFRYG